MTAILKAHGVEVKWCADGGWRHLSPDCEEAFRKIDLRWHDLRHEYASRLVEHGVPLAQVRDLLGHASITTTERYDNQKLENLQASAAKLEAGKIFVPSPSTATKPAPARARSAGQPVMPPSRSGPGRPSSGANDTIRQPPTAPSTPPADRDAATLCQGLVKIAPQEASSADADRALELELKSFEGERLGELAGRQGFEPR